MKRENDSGGALLLPACGSPSPRQEFVQAIVRPEIDEADENIGQIGRAGPGCLSSFSASICGALPGLGCQAERQRREVGVIGCYAVKARARCRSVYRSLSTKPWPAGRFRPRAGHRARSPRSSRGFGDRLLEVFQRQIELIGVKLGQPLALRFEALRLAQQMTQAVVEFDQPVAFGNRRIALGDGVHIDRVVYRRRLLLGVFALIMLYALT